MSKKFGNIVAIDRVNLEINEGEYICVLGPTGSGKTTLLRLIAGVIKPSEGEIYIDDKLVNNVPPQERNVAYVPQHYALFPHLRVIENVAFGPVAKGVSREEAFKISRRMLEMTRLAWRANSFPDELSGGMQQRIALARGLASGAKLLLLDEPLGALDARLRVELRYKLRDLVKERDLTVIHVTHDQEEALVVGDRIVVLRHGCIQQDGDPFDIYNKPESIFVASFVGGANFLEGFIVEKGRRGSWVQLRYGLRILIQETAYSVGERVVVAIREELTKISRRGRRKVNIILGRVGMPTFLGNFVVYEVVLENGDVVHSRIPIYRDNEKFKMGERVFVHLDPKYIKVYPYPSVGLYAELEAI